MSATKPFVIPKMEVWRAYLAVKSNGGTAGVDEQSLEEFEQNLKGNLYRIWNRMSSGTYFPPPVKAVPIPKKSGGTRVLGVQTRERQDRSNGGEEGAGADAGTSF